MNRPALAPVRSLMLTAFSIWFVHFLLCWAAVEIWPGEPLANRLAWGFTVLALAAMGWHFSRVQRLSGQGGLVGFGRRFAQGAVAIATVALLFTAVPALVFLP